MKNYLLSFALLLVGNLLIGQNIIEEKFQHLYDHDKATVVHVTGKMFSYANHFKDTSDEDLNQIAEFASTMNEFTLVAMKEWPNSEKEYNSGMGYIHDDLEELIRVRSEEGNFSLYVDETNDVVHELVGIGTDTKNFVVFSLTGEMDLEQIGKIASEINMDGFKEMEAIEKYEVSSVKVFPNPVKGNENISLEIPENLDNATATLYDEDGRKIDTRTVNSGKQSLSFGNLESGVYFIDIQKDGVNIKKKFIVVN